jgi:hypothetical protein
MTLEFLAGGGLYGSLELTQETPLLCTLATLPMMIAAATSGNATETT